MLTFTAIDIETANPDLSSICQIGIVSVVDGRIREAWQSLVNPETEFDPFNVHLHGIREADVADSPRIPDIARDVRVRLGDSLVVSHSPFDRSAVTRALQKYELEPLTTTWLDSVRIARIAWPSGFGPKNRHKLHDIADALGITFTHHDALEDARACAEIVILASESHGLDMDGWVEHFTSPSRLQDHAGLPQTSRVTGTRTARCTGKRWCSPARYQCRRARKPRT